MMQQVPQRTKPNRVSSGGSTSSQNRFHPGPRQSLGTTFSNKENVYQNNRNAIAELKRKSRFHFANEMTKMEFQFSFAKIIKYLFCTCF